jgi:hypothetical protein
VGSQPSSSIDVWRISAKVGQSIMRPLTPMLKSFSRFAWQTLGRALVALYDRLLVLGLGLSVVFSLGIC